MRKYQLKRALEAGISIDRLHAATGIDPWFLDQLLQIVEHERWFAELPSIDADSLRRMKREGFSDAQLGLLRGVDEAAIRSRRRKLGVRPTFNVVDTCAGEFPAEDALLLLVVRVGGRGPPVRATEGGHPG